MLNAEQTSHSGLGIIAKETLYQSQATVSMHIRLEELAFYLQNEYFSR